jgi:putative membrane protein
VLAKERTFAAWVRTGLSAVAVGFGGARLLTDLEPQALVLASSLMLVVGGIMAIVFGFWSFRDTLAELGEGGFSLWLIGTFTLLLVLASVALLVLMFLD